MQERSGQIVKPLNSDEAVEHVNNMDSSRESLVVNEKILQDSVVDKISETMEQTVFSKSRAVIESVVGNVLVRFKNRLRAQLINMGVDKYTSTADRQDDLVQQIFTDYRKNVNEDLNFNLIVQRDEDGEPEKISLRADKFIDSVDLDKVVMRVNNEEIKKEQKDNIDFNKYLQVVEGDATETIDRIKKKKELLTLEVRRWFKAMQIIIDVPKRGESFKNYLQRAMSMKSEIDSNLKNPDRENIENSLKEVVPILYKGMIIEEDRNGVQVNTDSEEGMSVGDGSDVMDTNQAKMNGRSPLARRLVNSFIDRLEVEQRENIRNKNSRKGIVSRERDNFILDNKKNKPVIEHLDDVVASINKDKKRRNQRNEIDLSEYLEVSDMNARVALQKLKRVGSSLGFNVRNWLKIVQLVLGSPNEEESLGSYLQKSLNRRVEIDSRLVNVKQENIKNTLEVIMPILHKSILLDKLGK